MAIAYTAALKLYLSLINNTLGSDEQQALIANFNSTDSPAASIFLAYTAGAMYSLGNSSSYLQGYPHGTYRGKRGNYHPRLQQWGHRGSLRGNPTPLVVLQRQLLRQDIREHFLSGVLPMTISYTAVLRAELDVSGNGVNRQTDPFLPIINPNSPGYIYLRYHQHGVEHPNQLGDLSLYGCSQHDCHCAGPGH